MKSRRVELFASSELDHLEAEMNNWLDDNGDAHVIDIRLSVNCIPEPEEPTFDILYSAVIFCEVLKE